MQINFVAVTDDEARNWRNGGSDAYGNLPERTISDGDGNPCRHCLRDIAAGKPMLVLSHRPFASLQPYAETGPVFVCAEPCERFVDSADLPAVVSTRQEFIVRGYDNEERIKAGTGRVVPVGKIRAYAQSLLLEPDVEAVHIRSASNNCYFCKIKRAE